ncbi:DUF3786 domain-containing protein [Calderihabitans maritimus]|uniref:DUF3786 domain-containing protein n=1 Tax=Calderihabitans maritimus TaxID=1246530 RepID=A0A1Z5HRC6_9FIRM|nr:DUF3786 domain-containing protein [Calderihabitans maritimus]GAW92076.1 hypothetical protein KKC1_12360 [Calderihabitans maritimus]
MAIEIQGNYEDAYRQAVKEFSEKDPHLMARWSKARFDREKSVFCMRYCATDYFIHYPTGKFDTEEKIAIPLTDQIIMLQYLTQASGMPIRNRWLSFMELPGGPHHYAPFRQEAINPISQTFGDRLELFRQVALSLDGKATDMGDAGYILPVLPGLPLAYILWQGDEEFPPNANILFDYSASTYLPTATLYVLGINTTLKMLERARKFESRTV